MRTISVETATKELAKIIKETSEYQTLAHEKGRVELDSEARKMLEDLEQSHLNIQEGIRSGEKPSNEQIQLLKQKQDQALQNETLRQFFLAQEEFGKIMEEVSEILSKELLN